MIHCVAQDTSRKYGMANASPTVTINTKEALAAFYAAQASGNITGLLSIGGQPESPGFAQFESSTPQTKKESFFILDENNDDMVIPKHRDSYSL